MSESRLMLLEETEHRLFSGWSIIFVNSPQKASDKLHVGKLSLDQLEGGTLNVIDV